MSGETQIEVHIHHQSVSDPMSKLSLVTGGGSTGMHSSGGSTGDDSSGEEHHHHHVVLPKKIRLKEPNNNCLSSIKSGNSLMSLICSGNSKEMIVDDQSQDDDDCNDLATKEGGGCPSLTSGENSDADVGLDGEDHLSSHLKSDDSSKKMFECDVCNMRFSNGANMRRHRMRHSGIKPFECKICQKRFFRKDHLAEHMATHSKLLPFRCPICNKGFQRQIAMRAHFQNEHVGGGSQDIVKACPLCAYKAGSMKSLRFHFYSRHGIDLDNPMPNSPSLLCPSNGRTSGSPGPNTAEYSELAHALGFEDREKSSDSSLIPSHFLVPQIEISSNSPYPTHFGFTAESSYGYTQSESDRHSAGTGCSTPTKNISPQSVKSDSSSNLPSSSDLVTVVVKKEVLDDHYSPQQSSSSISGNSQSKELSDINDDIQDMPEDLSSGSASSFRSTHSPKCTSSSLLKVSPLKSLLKEDWRTKESAQNDSSNKTSSRSRSDSSSGQSSSSAFPNQSCDMDAITSSNGPDNGTSHSTYGRRGLPFPALHQCVYCGIIFPDKTLYFLHKGCHSESNPWRCNICGESCTNVYDFNSHLLSKSHQ